MLKHCDFCGCYKILERNWKFVALLLQKFDILVVGTHVLSSIMHGMIRFLRYRRDSLYGCRNGDSFNFTVKYPRLRWLWIAFGDDFEWNQHFLKIDLLISILLRILIKERLFFITYFWSIEKAGKSWRKNVRYCVL